MIYIIVYELTNQSDFLKSKRKLSVSISCMVLHVVYHSASAGCKLTVQQQCSPRCLCPTWVPGSLAILLGLTNALYHLYMAGYWNVLQLHCANVNADYFDGFKLSHVILLQQNIS